MQNSIVETRTRDESGQYHIVLTVNEKDYEAVYNTVNNDIAREIITMYLENHGDDGRPDNIQIRHNKNMHMVEVMADLNYLGNEHTTYAKHYGNYFSDLIKQK